MLRLQPQSLIPRTVPGDASGLAAAALESFPNIELQPTASAHRTPTAQLPKNWSGEAGEVSHLNAAECLRVPTISRRRCMRQSSAMQLLALDSAPELAWQRL